MDGEVGSETQMKKLAKQQEKKKKKKKKEEGRRRSTGLVARRGMDRSPGALVPSPSCDGERTMMMEKYLEDLERWLGRSLRRSPPLSSSSSSSSSPPSSSSTSSSNRPSSLVNISASEERVKPFIDAYGYQPPANQLASDSDRSESGPENGKKRGRRGIIGEGGDGRSDSVYAEAAAGINIDVRKFAKRMEKTTIGGEEGRYGWDGGGEEKKKKEKKI